MVTNRRRIRVEGGHCDGAGIVLLQGKETRIFVVPHPDDPKRIKSIPVPAEVRRRFGA